jgi:transglutaminase-like putative cysteine protease
MNAPPLLVGATLLFWGWEVNHLFIGAVSAVVYEMHRWVAWRWDFSTEDFSRLWDFTGILLLGTLVAGYVSGAFRDDAIGLVRWFPLFLLPLAAAQVYSAKNRVTLATISWIVRRWNRAGNLTPQTPVSVSYPYFGFCIMAASAANARDLRFYAGLCVLAAWALWPVRSVRMKSPIWAAVLMAAMAGGFVLQDSLHTLQGRLEGYFNELICNLRTGDYDLTEARTAIGSIGRIKLSSRILARVRPERGKAPPSLLRMASYESYQSDGGSARWFNSRKRFRAVYPQNNLTTWKLGEVSTPQQRATVWSWVAGGEGVLPTVTGVSRIARLPATEMEVSPLGAVRVKGAPGLARYDVFWGQPPVVDSSPTDEDRRVPDSEKPALMKISRELGLASLPPREALAAVERFFSKHFTYTQYLSGGKSDRWAAATPLRIFLLEKRSGHCEYFGTATALLLRQAGIPARYATGYSVQEYSRFAGLYVVRGRHAHAWCLAWVDGHWEDVDTTPSSWVADEESQMLSVWDPFTDFFSHGWFRFSEWRWFGDRSAFVGFLPWILAVIVVVFLGRLIIQKKRKALVGRSSKAASTAKRSGTDSEFYRVEKRLSELAFPRQEAETLAAWLTRIERDCMFPIDPLRPLLQLHDRLRFDPAGLETKEREVLRTGVESWLGRMSKGSARADSDGCSL